MKNNKLKGRIIEKYGSIGKFADTVGASKPTVSNKLSGRSAFTRQNIILWSQALQISRDELGEYFFSEKS